MASSETVHGLPSQRVVEQLPIAVVQDPHEPKESPVDVKAVECTVDASGGGPSTPDSIPPAEGATERATPEGETLEGAAAADSQASKVTTTSTLMEDVKLKAAEMSSQNGAEDLAKDIYHLKWVKFKGRKVPLVTQNINGPCPLLAIVNVLLLNEKITLDHSEEVVTSSQLMGYLGDIVLQAMPTDLEQGEQANWEQNVNDAIVVFHKLQTGLDVNVRFTGVQDFEYTPECIVFDLLNISLFHGWLVDTALPDTVTAVGNLTYNQLVEKIIENQGSLDEAKSTQAVLGQMFLDDSASQLTYHGLSELASTLEDDQMAVFFRNNHFSTIYKQRGELFLLVTDQGYLRESRIVWETLCNVEGDGHLVDSEFRTANPSNPDPLPQPVVPANTKEQVDQDLLLALSLSNTEEAIQDNALASETDAEFALRLQEEEDRRSAIQHQQAEQTAPKPQPQSAPRRQRESGRESPDSPSRQRTRKRSGSCTVL